MNPEDNTPLRAEEIEALHQVAKLAAKATQQHGRTCLVCDGRLDRPVGCARCRGPGCLGYELREALAALTVVMTGPPYGVWITPYEGDDRVLPGMWAVNEARQPEEFSTMAWAQAVADIGRRIRPNWGYEVRSKIASAGGKVTPDDLGVQLLDALTAPKAP